MSDQPDKNGPDKNGSGWLILMPATDWLRLFGDQSHFGP